VKTSNRYRSESSEIQNSPETLSQHEL